MRTLTVGQTTEASPACIENSEARAGIAADPPARLPPASRHSEARGMRFEVMQRASDDRVGVGYRRSQDGWTALRLQVQEASRLARPAGDPYGDQLAGYGSAHDA